MIISRTPHRISLCGGGSDLKEYYKNNVGVVLSFAINKYQYHFLEKSFDNKNYLTYLNKNEIVNNIDDIKHKGLKIIFNKYDIKNINYKVISNIYHNVGLGSSSCFYVGLYTLLNEYKGLNLSKKNIAELACNMEIDILNMPIGKQDQYATSLGGINLIEFYSDEKVKDTNLNFINYQKLIDNIIIFKIDRISSNKILKSMNHDIKKNTKILNKMTDFTYMLKNDLINNNFDNVGLILNENWQCKKQLNNNISNDYIENIYNIGLKSGATGGKILGAGGGGCILFYTNDKDKLRYNIKLEEIDFDIDLDGTKIIYK